MVAWHLCPRPTFGPAEARTTQKFSCEWNCYYCPNEPKQPRSYLHDEPSVLRGNQNGFDAVLQFTERVATLVMNGHPPDKIELLVLGGTWTSYPHAYQEEFCRDLFYAANTFSTRGAALRPRLSLDEEQAANCVDTYVPGPPFCTYGPRVPASCVLYVPAAQGGWCATVRTPYAYQPRACRTYRVPWHPRPPTRAPAARS